MTDYATNLLKTALETIAAVKEQEALWNTRLTIAQSRTLPIYGDFLALAQPELIVNLLNEYAGLQQMWRNEHDERIRLEVRLMNAEIERENWRDTALGASDD